MYIQIHTGESDENSQNQGGNAQTLIVLVQSNAGFEGCDGVTGGEGEVVGGIYQQLAVYQKILPVQLQNLQIIIVGVILRRIF